MAQFTMIAEVPYYFSDVGTVQPGEVHDFDEAPSATWWEPVAPTPTPEPAVTPEV